MDTSVMEYTAEDLIAHKLLRSSILVAKPKFDQEGADLLAFLAVNDGARFCRIQCKGRSLIGAETAHMDVRSDWVTDAFIVFLFVETGRKGETYLYCFTSDEIRDNWTGGTGHFSLTITPAKIESDLVPFRFSEEKVERIKTAHPGRRCGQGVLPGHPWHSQRHPRTSDAQGHAYGHAWTRQRVSWFLDRA